MHVHDDARVRPVVRRGRSPRRWWYLGRRLVGPPEAQQLEAIHVRQLPVQQHQVRLLLLAQPQDLLAVLGLAHHLHMQMLAQQQAQALARQWLDDLPPATRA